MSAQVPWITLMTDFGREDVFVGVMKGVIAGICPAARVIDLCHAIPRFDVTQAAFRSAEAYPYFPKGTIHAIVVDPGVGGDRRIVAMESDGHIFIAPDNGALWLIEKEKGHNALVAVMNENRFLPEISGTFHGRDIFAPVAAHLAAGAPLSALGPPVEQIESLDMPAVERASDGSLKGAVLWADHFGNLITNIRVSDLTPDRDIRVSIAGRMIEGLQHTYADVPEGEALAMIGSFGALEIAVRLGSAKETLGAGPGAEVRVTYV